MSAPKYLIDTNVFIGLEDPREVPAELASLTQLAAKHGVGVFVHEVAREDLTRDADIGRRRISLSKVSKFPLIAKVRGLTEDRLAAEFGPLPRPNDVVDATLLHALRLGVADFVVTEDKGLHDRARRYAPELARRVLYVADAVLLLRSTYEPIDVALPFVEEMEAHSIPLTDPIFDSLREGYSGFDNWWMEKCVRTMRKCWVVVDEERLDGIIVRKEETAADTDARTPARKILKICTFKVRPERRGIKLGELLLKQALWFAQTNQHDLVYLTTYPEQSALIDLLEYYGFSRTYSKQDGEAIYEKPLRREALIAVPGQSLFDAARLNYPRFSASVEVEAYGIPIKEAFHEALFPELADRRQPSLFARAEDAPRTPGNTIRKVYLCQANAKIGQPGALLLFYKGKSSGRPSQAITTVGIFEDMRLAHSLEELRRLAGGRSVYSEHQLVGWRASEEGPVKVINFLLAGHIYPPVSLDQLLEDGVFARHPPQSIFRLRRDRLEPILRRMHLGFDL